MAQDFVHPIEALMVDVAAAMPGGLVHRLGLRSLHDSKAPPVYVWVPDRGRASKLVPTRRVDEHRTTEAIDLSAEVYVKGRTFREAWAMTNNLRKALQDVAQEDVDIDSVEHMEPSESYNQGGETVRLNLTLQTCLFDVYVPLDTLQAPDASTVIAVKVIGDLESSDDVSSSGEYALTVET